MFEIDKELGKEWYNAKTNNWHVPRYIDVECPFCSRSLVNVKLAWKFLHSGSVIHACIGCKESTLFIIVHPPTSQKLEDREQTKIFMYPAPKVREKFSENIKAVSPSFEPIYTQALTAEKLGLHHICGMGYRKALEFLLREYLMYKYTDKKESIQSTKQLGAVISNFVENDEVKVAAKRAAWLGNDETHYQRVWVNQDAKDLKKLIHVVAYWIQMDLFLKDIQETMPDPKKKEQNAQIAE